MFARDYVDLDRPFPDVALRFVPDTDWLVPLAERAVRSARALIDRLAGDAGDAPDDRVVDGGPVRCDTGPVRTAGVGILVPVSITVDGGSALPHLVGELEVAPVGHLHSQVSVNVTYRRPTPSDARHRVERAVAAGLREFLRGIAEHVDAPAPGSRRVDRTVR